MTNFKAIIIADAHIGADKFGASPERWDAPVAQAFEYAVEVKADVVISAGDFMHKRNPTVAEHLRRRELLDILGEAQPSITLVEVDGNHDRANSEGSHSALSVVYPSPMYMLFQGSIGATPFGGVGLLGLPWPRPVDYLNEEQMKLGIDEKIELTRQSILSKITGMMTDPVDLPVILFGHAMLAYGPNHDDPKDPGLILGKDVVLPYQAFIDAGLTANQLFFGHVHDPSALGYVGSTQPTDWSDAEHDKSFVELDIAGRCEALPEDGPDHAHLDNATCSNGWVYYVQRHSYTDQIRLHDIVVEDGAGELLLKKTPVDVARVTVNLKQGGSVDEVFFKLAIESQPNYGRLDRVIINHPKREAARVETSIAMADMPASEAFELWMKQAGYTADEAMAPYKEFESLIAGS